MPSCSCRAAPRRGVARGSRHHRSEDARSRRPGREHRREVICASWTKLTLCERDPGQVMARGGISWTDGIGRPCRGSSHYRLHAGFLDKAHSTNRTLSVARMYPSMRDAVSELLTRSRYWTNGSRPRDAARAVLLGARLREMSSAPPRGAFRPAEPPPTDDDRACPAHPAGRAWATATMRGRSAPTARSDATTATPVVTFTDDELTVQDATSPAGYPHQVGLDRAARDPVVLSSAPRASWRAGDDRPAADGTALLVLLQARRHPDSCAAGSTARRGRRSSRRPMADTVPPSPRSG